MAGDDYWRRRQDSDDYLRRLDDQAYFRKQQEQRTKAVFEGIIEKNEAKARAALGIPPRDDAPAASDSDEDSRKPPLAEDQVEDSCRKLAHLLATSRFVPPAAVENWTRALAELRSSMGDSRPWHWRGLRAGLTTVQALLTDLDMISDRTQPRPNIFDLAIEEGMRHFGEMTAIKLELRWLDRVLQHVDALLKERREALLRQSPFGPLGKDIFGR
jgi:hypothetical protein